MSVITIRSLDPVVKARIQARAKVNGRSMEAEIRAILADVPGPAPSGIRAGIAAVREVVGDTDIPDGWLVRNNEPPRALFS